METHRKFNFDNPEDSYWNDGNSGNSHFSRQSSLAAASFFDDNDFAEASNAASDIFGAADVLKALPTASPTAFKNSNEPSKWIDVSFNDVQSLSDKSSVVGSQKECDERERALRGYGGASIISDCSVGSRSSDLTDYVRLKSEHKKLQKHFENIRNERFKPLPVAEAVKRLSKCQPLSLDLYRTNDEKIALLEASLSSLDHDVITTVILFLKRTLNNPIFREILITNAEAAKHYVHFLEDSNDTPELIDTLFALGRCADAAMVEFQEACRMRRPESKLKALKKCLVSGFSVPALEKEAKYVRAYIATLE